MVEESEMRDWRTSAVVVAAGRGSRMGSQVHKQYMELEGKPVLYYALRTLEASPLIDEVVVVTGRDEVDYFRIEIQERYSLKKIKAVLAGGVTRSDSVRRGLEACSAQTDYICIHDGVRPFLSEEILSRGLDSARAFGSGVAGVPSKDTVKLVDENRNVVNTPDRALVWNIQTPQIFRADLLREAYQRMGQEDLSGITDDAMLVERTMDVPVHIFEGAYTNLKITTPEDMLLAERILRESR